MKTTEIFQRILLVATLAMVTPVVYASDGRDLSNSSDDRRAASNSSGSVTDLGSGSVTDLERRIAELERLLQEVKRQQAVAKAEIEEAKQKVEEVVMQKPAGVGISPKNSKLSFYGSIRPALTYFDSELNNPHGFEYEVVNPADPGGSIELSDFFSRIGIKGETKIGSITAFARGEMEIAIDQDGDFDPRLAFAGVQGDFGRLAIGRQWHPHYNTIVEVTDLYNHRSSPFGYDRQGPFRRPGLVTYSNSTSGGTWKLDTALQFSGDDGDGRRRGNNTAGGANDDRAGADSGSIGVSYANDRYYLGLSHLKRNRENGHSRDFYGVGASVNLTDNLYLATTLQGIKQGRDDEAHDNGHSVDIVGAYAMGNGLKLIAGYFNVDAAGRESPNDAGYTDGFNLTLQKQISDNVRIFGEWLQFGYDNATPGDEDSVNAISTGIRYDFSVDVF